MCIELNHVLHGYCQKEAHGLLKLLPPPTWICMMNLMLYRENTITCSQGVDNIIIIVVESDTSGTIINYVIYNEVSLAKCP